VVERMMAANTGTQERIRPTAPRIMIRSFYRAI
jgi:hypothetical protein